MNFWTFCIVAVICATVAGIMTNEQEGYFSQVPTEDIHTMRVWEDGSFEIVYKDQGKGQTSEIGCLPGGLCED